MQNADRRLQRIGKSFQKTGRTLTTGVTAPILALGGIAIKTFADFEQELAKVNAISGATGVEFEALKQSALDLGATTRFTATEVAGLQLNLSKLGFNPAEINEATASVLDLALATGEELAQSATVAASTVKGFGLQISDTNRVVDVMAASFSESALDLSKFQVAMASVAPVARGANATLEQTTGLLAVLVNAGLDASTAGTGLRNVFLQLSKQGISLNDALLRITRATDRNRAALELFGTRGSTVGSLLAENIDAANDFAGSFTNAAGAAARMADIMGDTTQGALFRLKSAVEGLAISFGEELAPLVNAAAESLGDIANVFREFEPSLKRQIIQVAAFAASIGPLILVAGALVKSIAAITAAIRVMTLAIAANPLGALAIAITAVVAAMGLYAEIQNRIASVRSNLNDFEAQAIKNATKEQAQLESLVVIARSERVSKEQRLKAIQEINRVSPKYLGNLSLETINTDTARIAIEKYNAELLRSARAKAAQNQLEEITADIIEIQLDEAIRADRAEKSRLETIRELQAQGFSYADAVERVNFLNEVGNKIADNKLVNLQEQQKVLLDIINSTGDLSKVERTLPPNINPIGQTLPGEDEGRDSGRRFAFGFLDEAASSFGGARELFDDELGEFDGFEFIETALDGFEERLRDFNTNVNEILQDGVVDGISNAFAAIGESIVDGGNVLGTVGAAILGVIGSVAVRLGKAAIGIGIAMQAIKVSFKNPFTAIAAGAALIALGSALGSIANNAISGGGASASTSELGSSSISGSSVTTTSNASSSAFSGTVVFEIGYDKLIGVLEQGQAARLRTQ